MRSLVLLVEEGESMVILHLLITDKITKVEKFYVMDVPTTGEKF